MSDATPGIEVLAPGLASTLQDLGRFGRRHLGVAWSGAADPWSHTLANLLVGNPGDAASLEITLTGPTLRFATPTRIALCGAKIDARAGGLAIPGDRPVMLPAGTVLRLGRCRGGARAYLAVAGGFRAASRLGSLATDVRGGFGGHEGRPLHKGDRLSGGHPLESATDTPVAARWWIDASPGPAPTPSDAPCRVRLLPGRDACPDLFASAWQIDAGSNRQGLRLQGPALRIDDRRERVSEPVAPGTVQLPPDGQPIVLLADAQTHGGYPRIGHAIRADWPLLAQAGPGDRIRFVPCSPHEAHAAGLEQRQRLYRIALAIRARQDRHA